MGESASNLRIRAARFVTGVRGLCDCLTDKHAETKKLNERDAYAALARDRAPKDALIFAQLKDRQVLQDQIRAVRERHAALLKELRTDRREVKENVQAERHGAGSRAPVTRRTRSNAARAEIAPSISDAAGEVGKYARGAERAVEIERGIAEIGGEGISALHRNCQSEKSERFDN